MDDALKLTLGGIATLTGLAWVASPSLGYDLFITEAALGFGVGGAVAGALLHGAMWLHLASRVTNHNIPLLGLAAFGAITGTVGGFAAGFRGTLWLLA